MAAEIDSISQAVRQYHDTFRNDTPSFSLCTPDIVANEDKKGKHAPELLIIGINR